jgi:TRAP-type C4-dicarboxylate transport system permease small subunit
MVQSLKRLFDAVYSISQVIAGVAFGFLCLSVGVQVASRYLFNVSFAWAEELPLFLFLWVCFIAAAAAYRQNSHLGVTLLFDRLPAGFRKVARYLELLITLAFFCVVFYYELDVANSIGSSFVVLKFPKYFYFIGIPVAAAIFIIFIIEKIIEQIIADRSAAS